VVVTNGLAIGFAILVALNPVAGAQLYVLAPLAVNCTESLLHMLIGLAGSTVKVGLGFTVIVTIALSLQAPLVPTTV
jgi:hypothetical protein